MECTVALTGVQLSRLLYQEVVRPFMSERFASLRYSAALLGRGSEVLHCDVPTSQDHDWGCRLLLFISEDDYKAVSLKGQYVHAHAGQGSHTHTTIQRDLDAVLPHVFHGVPTRFGSHDDGTGELSSDGGKHRVEVHTVSMFLRCYLGSAFTSFPHVSAKQWVGAFAQKLASIIQPENVFQDELRVNYGGDEGALEHMMRVLRWYPEDVWRYVLASCFQSISQELPFVGRAGHAGDDIGSRVVCARLVRAAMMLCFVQRRQWPPYSKHLGMLFSRLDGIGETEEKLLASLKADDWRLRQRILCEGLSLICAYQSSLGMADEHPTDEVCAFHTRPYDIVRADKFAEVLASSIPPASPLCGARLVGPAWLLTDVVEVLEDADALHSMTMTVHGWTPDGGDL